MFGSDTGSTVPLGLGAKKRKCRSSIDRATNRTRPSWSGNSRPATGRAGESCLVDREWGGSRDSLARVSIGRLPQSLLEEGAQQTWAAKDGVRTDLAGWHDGQGR
jgi:hypothetical protein